MNKNPENPAKPDKSFICTTAQVCTFFDISRETLSGWAKKGAPKEGRGSWDLKKLVQWKYGTDDDREQSLESRKLKADVRYRETKADIEELKKQEKVGRYAAVEDFEKQLTEVFSRIKQGLLFMGHRIATELNAQYPELALEAKRLVDEEIEKGLMNFARTGTYSKRKRKTDA